MATIGIGMAGTLSLECGVQHMADMLQLRSLYQRGQKRSAFPNLGHAGDVVMIPIIWYCVALYIPREALDPFLTSM